MVDKVKPLKVETTIDGSSNDFLPVETKPDQDYVAAKGIAFTNSDSFLLDVVGRSISAKVPTRYCVPAYLANGEVDTVTYYNSASFITANRVYLVTMAYDGSLNPTSETWVVYDTDGSTVLRTITKTFTSASDDITQVQLGVS